MNLKLLVARKRLNLSQAQLAEKAGVPQPDISKIEKQGWIPPAEIRDRLAVALETTPTELFDVSESIAS